MKIDATMFKLKFKEKIPVEDESKFANILVTNMAYLDVITHDVVNWTLEDIETKRKEIEEVFVGLSKRYSDLFKEYAKIRLKANELYTRNRTVALTMGVLRLKLMTLRDQGIELPIEEGYDKAIEKVEYFIYRYLTKKEDERLKEDDKLIDQVVFPER
ncbi:MAG: hypothetical protein ACTSYD_12145 [Candidatus Heimdallarchaeaceae archaeon]